MTAETGMEINYAIGTMIELPGLVVAGEIAEYAEFFPSNKRFDRQLSVSADDAEEIPALYSGRKSSPLTPSWFWIGWGRKTDVAGSCRG